MSKDEKIAQTQARIARLEQDFQRLTLKMEQAKAKLAHLESQG